MAETSLSGKCLAVIGAVPHPAAGAVHHGAAMRQNPEPRAAERDALTLARIPCHLALNEESMPILALGAFLNQVELAGIRLGRWLVAGV